jgi:uncharacterized protein (DUF934 family)
MKPTIELFKADSFTAAENGVLTLANDADPRDAALDGIHTVQLQFPGFADGRAFSQAFLLRRRLGFTGQIRATGDVLIDQLQQMQRSGFTQAVLRADQNIEHGRRLLAQYDAFYQGDAVDTRPHFATA